MPRFFAVPIMLTLLAAVLTGCGASQPGLAGIAGSEPDSSAAGPPQTAGLPVALPVDALQPWEQLNAAGLVERGNGGRSSSALGADSEFVAGVERFMEGGDTIDNGEAVSLFSAAGSLSFSIYRLPLGGGEPGVVSVDANTLEGAGYYVGLADYAANAWDWHGPFSDNHVRFSVAGPGTAADLTSPLGSVFVCVAAYGGAACDVVGVSVDLADGGDSTAPPAPAAPAATPLTGAVQLDWLPVAAGDLAGYRIYHNRQFFVDGRGTGVRVVDGLEGLTSHVLAGYSAELYVRISAVDVSGNESPLSGIVSVETGTAAPLPLRVTVSAPSGALNQPVALTASGADTYDFDTDGDGIFDITGDASGSAFVDTSALGILRPRVRGASGDGMLVALGGVSVIIAGNSRPVASARASVSSGIAPLEVTLTGGDSTDFDGEIVGGGWDFDGDGTYDVWSDTDTVAVTSAVHTFSDPGVYNAKLRVVDNDGAWDVDTVALLVTPDPNPANESPNAALSADRAKTYAPFTIRFDASGSFDPDGSIVLYEWDYNGDDTYDAAGPSPTSVYTYPVRGSYRPAVRVTDQFGASASAYMWISLPTEWPTHSRSIGFSGQSPYIGAQTSNVSWTYPTGENIFSAPCIGVDGTVYFGNSDSAGGLFAVSPEGELKWLYSAGASVSTSPALGDDGTVYFAASNGFVYAVTPGGLLRWAKDMGTNFISSPCVGAGGQIYIGGMDGILYAFDRDGTTLWTYDADAPIWATPAVDADGTIYITAETTGLHAIGSDGNEKWNDAAVGEMRSSPGVSPSGTIYVGDDDSMFYSYESDGTQNWALPLSGVVFGAPSFGFGGAIYVCCQSASDSLYAISPLGEALWSFPTGGSASSAPAIGADGVIYFGSFDGFVYAVTGEGNELWNYDTGALWVESSAAIAADGKVYIGDQGGTLIAFGPGDE